jgi:alpha-L-fucosidase
MISIPRLVLATLTFLATVSSVLAQQRFEADWKSLRDYDVPEWFMNAKFGIFIHWGIYSVPAFQSEWYPRHMYEKGHKIHDHHVATYGTPDKFGYKDFIPMFKAEKFNAGEWVDLFSKSGARYVVPVAEHHDGFAMYGTAISRWNAVEMGPRKDIIGELSEACRSKNLIFGVSSHRIEHWWFMNEGRKIASDVNDSAYHDFYGPAKVFDPWDKEKKGVPISTEFMNDWLLRTTELVEKYQPQLVWFDWWIEQPELEPYRKSFAAYYYNKGIEWKKGVVINYKLDSYPKDVAVFDIERGSSKATKKDPWQTDTSIGKKSWGFIEDEENKSPNELVDMLIDVVSKNGNLLLNIGPKADGTIAIEQQEVLLEIGKWLAVNGEGIYDTRPWELAGEGPTENADEDIQFNEYKFKGYTEKDIRFTKKGDKVYALVLDVPTEKINITSLGLQSGHGKISQVTLLGGTGEKVKWNQEKNALVIQPRASYPSRYAACYKVDFQ